MAEGHLKQMGENMPFYSIAARKSEVYTKYKKASQLFVSLKNNMRVNSQMKRTKEASAQVVNFANCS